MILSEMSKVISECERKRVFPLMDEYLQEYAQALRSPGDSVMVLDGLKAAQTMYGPLVHTQEDSTTRRNP
jgi:hypothetical protein